jgi:hypothetical protein
MNAMNESGVAVEYRVDKDLTRTTEQLLEITTIVIIFSRMTDRELIVSM